MDMSQEDVIKRIFAEYGLDAEGTLRALVRSLVDRHVRCKKDPRIGTGGQGLRPTVMEELIVAIGHERNANLKAHDRLTGGGAVAGAGPGAAKPAKLGKNMGLGADAEKIAAALAEGRAKGQLAAIQAALVDMLYNCQVVGERLAGVEEESDDDDDRPPMRLVKD